VPKARIHHSICKQQISLS